ncbi:MAG: SDR family oxidoreductase [Anaerolineae bacterium]|nr:SDR family oxidoreductase [Anaerolineae bacterium]
MSTAALAGKTALVTGASSGLGVTFARELAARGADLILVARREDRLRAVQQEIAATYGVAVDVLPLDLLDEAARQDLHDRLQAQGKAVDILVNNAGFGLYGNFVEVDWPRERNMLELDIVALVHLTKLFVPDMVARGSGYVLLLSSIGAYQPSPTYGSYSAAKSFVLYFGESLHYELRGTNVSVTVLSPGVTRTEFHQVAGQTLTWYQRVTMMTAEQVARIGIDAMLKRRASVVVGWVNALMAWTARFVPRQWAASITNRLMTSG